MWVYMRSETGLFTTGYYDPKGVWHPDKDFDNKDAASNRVHFLNGGEAELEK